MTIKINNVLRSVRLYCNRCTQGMGKRCGKFNCELWPYRAGNDFGETLSPLADNGFIMTISRPSDNIQLNNEQLGHQ